MIGDGTFVGHGCEFHVGRSVRIGNHCLLASGVGLFDLDGHPLDAGDRRANLPTPPDAVRPVVIGDDVWLGIDPSDTAGDSLGRDLLVALGGMVAPNDQVDAEAIAAAVWRRLLRCAVLLTLG